MGTARCLAVAEISGASGRNHTAGKRYNERHGFFSGTIFARLQVVFAGRSRSVAMKPSRAHTTRLALAALAGVLAALASGALA
jgi:hypothetical protein